MRALKGVDASWSSMRNMKVGAAAGPAPQVKISLLAGLSLRDGSPQVLVDSTMLYGPGVLLTYEF